jgi:predicted aspartyl protease
MGGALALSLVVLLSQAEPPPKPVQGGEVPAPGQPLPSEPVVLEQLAVIGDEPRFVAPTREDRIGRIWAPVTVNGEGPFRMVLATGASSSALTPHLAQKLGLEVATAQTVMLRGATGSAAVPVVPVETLEVGDLLLEPGQLPIIPDALGGAEGLLGMDALTNMRIDIEFRHDRITIMRSKNQRESSGFETIPVKFLRGRLLVADAVMGGVPVKAIIDTGGQSTLGNMALRLALAERRRRGIQEGKLDQVVGSTLDVQVGTRLDTPSISLGSIIVRNPPITFADFEIFKHWKMTNEPTMLIGMDVIGLLDRLIIDYRRKELQVRLPRR